MTTCSKMPFHIIKLWACYTILSSAIFLLHKSMTTSCSNRDRIQNHSAPLLMSSSSLVIPSCYAERSLVCSSAAHYIPPAAASRTSSWFLKQRPSPSCSAILFKKPIKLSKNSRLPRGRPNLGPLKPPFGPLKTPECVLKVAYTLLTSNVLIIEHHFRRRVFGGSAVLVKSFVLQPKLQTKRLLGNTL